MPQMFPLLWLLLLFTVVLAMTITMSMAHHSSKNISAVNSQKMNKTFFMNWSW